MENSRRDAGTSSWREESRIEERKMSKDEKSDKLEGVPAIDLGELKVTGVVKGKPLRDVFTAQGVIESRQATLLEEIEILWARLEDLKEALTAERSGTTQAKLDALEVWLKEVERLAQLRIQEEERVFERIAHEIRQAADRSEIGIQSVGNLWVLVLVLVATTLVWAFC